MKWLLDSDSLFNRVLTRIFDTLLLSVLTILCSLPIITIGAALSALYDMMIKIVMDRDSNLFKSYFKSFAKNFWKGTVIWLISLLGFAFIGLNVYFLAIMPDLNQTIRIVILGMIVILFMFFSFITIYAFPLQARYENKVFQTIKNAFFISIAQFPRSFGLLFLCLVILVPALVTYEVMPLLIILEFSLGAYIIARNMVKVFILCGDKEAAGENVPEEEENTDLPEDGKQNTETEIEKI